jgi:hypothetical protein
VGDHEGRVIDLAAAAADPKSEAFQKAKKNYPWLKPGMDRNKIRREYVEHLIDTQYNQR